MLESATQMFDSSGFMAHGQSFSWTPSLLWTYVFSDTSIGLAYFSLPVALSYFIRKRNDFSFSWLLLLFVAFAFASGIAHFMAVWTIWRPDYWVDASIKVLTAVLSVATAAAVWPLIRKAVALPSGEAVRAANRALEQEIEVRRQAEVEIKELNAELERRVQERTLELEATNRQLEEQIAERHRAERKLQQTNANLERTVERLAQRSKETALVRELGEMLQTCATADEGGQLISRYAPQLIPDHGGSLFLQDQRNEVFEATASWGATAPSQQVITAEECWALRRGKPHLVMGEGSTVACRHLPKPIPPFSVCVPLSAHGEVLGLLNIHSDQLKEQDRAYQLGVVTQLAEQIADYASLALADIKLRETLRAQAIQDPLTGLYNRRFMEAALHREVRRAERDEESVGVLMLDIDHFKRFNDTYGHQAGDELMREIGRVLRSQIRAGDLACRYGGEEFVVILQVASLALSMQRADHLRGAVEAIRSVQGITELERVTVSIGVASFPESGKSWEAVLRAADNALYAAKQAGRNRVVQARAA